jgi:hypothetical protein
MPRWFKLTVAVATLALLVVEYFKPAPWTIGGALALLVTLVANGGEFAIGLSDRRARRTDELTTLNLTGK